MIAKPSISKPPIDSQWSPALDAVLRGGLKDKVRRFSDGASNILVPKTPVKSKRTIYTPPGAAGNVPIPPPPVCIPADVDGTLIAPPDNPLNLGDSYTLSADNPTGTPPLFYQWFITDGPTGTGTTLGFTLDDAMIQAKDGSGLGHITVQLILRNACNVGGESVTNFYPAQGTP